MSINGDFGADFIYAARCSRYQRQNPPVSTTRRPPSTAFSTTADDVFTDDEIYYFMVIKLKPAQARQILRDDPPPHEFYEMDAVVKAGYLFYYGVYKQHFAYDMQIFVERFYKEFYTYKCDNMSDEEALKKICNHTYKEWQRNQAKAIAERRQLMQDGRSTPDSRTSLSSYEDSDLLSMDSAAKEPLKFRTHHTLVRFGPGGRLIILAPRESISTIRIDHLKNHIANRSLRRNIYLMESFKGPLIYNETQPHTLQLFIERQIRDIYNSDVYKGNPDSNDTNDCLLIWKLLQMLIKQHGRVTGPDLAQLLVEDGQLDEDLRFMETKSPLIAQPSTGSTNDESSDLAECTNFLLRGCVDEAINSAIQDGCLFDALILAESLYAGRPDKLAAIRARLLATRSAQHPLSTLISVAESRPLPLLASTNTGDGRGWRSHVAILLANLSTPVSYDSIYRLGLDLAKKEFNSAADFCFLAVNLLSGYNCFVYMPTSGANPNRKGISLINATLPDDNIHSAQTAYGWSILDFCATEIFEFALRLAFGGHETVLSQSPVMQNYRNEYAQMLDSLGGFDTVVRAYTQMQGSVQPQRMLYETHAKKEDEAEKARQLAAESEAKKAVEAEKARQLAAELEARKAAEAENARRLAAELEARKVAEAENARRLAAELEARKAAEAENARRFAAQKATEPEKPVPSSVPSQQKSNSLANSGNKSASNSSRWLGGLIEKFIPATDEMKLPDDNKIPENERIRWDPDQGRYVGGVEEEVAPLPPPIDSFMPSNAGSNPYQRPAASDNNTSPSFQQPAMPTMSSQVQNSQPAQNSQPVRSNSMRRGGNRYLNAFVANGGSVTATDNQMNNAPSMLPDAPMSAPTAHFNFIPQAVDNDDDDRTGEIFSS